MQVVAVCTTFYFLNVVVIFPGIAICFLGDFFLQIVIVFPSPELLLAYLVVVLDCLD
jgi:hypothetical protein